jgi:hypothetical protein
VVFEKLNETLANHTCGAEDSDRVFFLHGVKHFSVQEKGIFVGIGKRR